ncbi:MAG: hypothetical protein Q4C54_10005 [Clostridia bacterium]|nr:hypothetical protein [Clostridia bacterium]
MRQGTCYIIAPLYKGEEKERMLQAGEEDFIICADGGYAAAAKHGIRPNLVIGDFDSMPASAVPQEV